MRIFSNRLALFHQSEYLKKEKALQLSPLDATHILTNIHHPDTVFALLTTLLDKGCQSIHLTMEERDYTTNTEAIEDSYTYKTTSHQFMKQLFPQFSDRITINLVNDIRPFIQNAHAVFLDINYLRDSLSAYKGAKHTVILNKRYAEDESP
jgi:hypothetical protein